ncbi:MAG: hypothetical protein Q9175_000247 [Cornicularia normoerica]
MSVNTLTNNLRSHYEFLEKKIRSITPTSSLPSESNSPNASKSRGVYEGYINLGGPEHASQVPAKSLQTFIHNGSPDDLNYDGIHLTYEMQQTSASPTPPHGGQPTAV